MSKNDNCHYACATNVAVNRGKECRERKALRQPWNRDTEGTDVTHWGRLFQVRGTVTGKVRLPTVYEPSV